MKKMSCSLMEMNLEGRFKDLNEYKKAFSQKVILEIKAKGFRWSGKGFNNFPV